MKLYKLSFFSILIFTSCTGQDSTEANVENTPAQTEDIITNELEEEVVPVNLFYAEIDSLSMDQIFRNWKSFTDKEEVIQNYHNGSDFIDRWSDKLWGRCCTEADMRLSEHLTLLVSTSHDSPKYPWSNTRDEDYKTAYVFEEKDSITISIRLNQNEDFYGHYGDDKLEDIISSKDTLMTRFRWSFINGYVKNVKTFEENRRIKTMQVWLNGVHECNVEVLDKPEVQQIVCDFPFFRDDEIELRPVEFYEGTKYDDVCISAIQYSLGYSLNRSIDEKKETWD
jgi:hypothetical protein